MNLIFLERDFDGMEIRIVNHVGNPCETLMTLIELLGIEVLYS